MGGQIVFSCLGELCSLSFPFFSFLFLGGLVPVMLCYFASLQMSFAIDLAFGEKVCMDCLLLNMDVTGQQHR